MPASKQQQVSLEEAAGAPRDLVEDIALAQGHEPVESEGKVLVDGDLTVDDVLMRSKGPEWEAEFIRVKQLGNSNKAAAFAADMAVEA
jgi:hypothetical protein